MNITVLSAKRLIRRSFATRAAAVSKFSTGVHHAHSLRRTALQRYTKHIRPRSTLTSEGAGSMVSTTQNAIQATSIPYRGLAAWLFGCSGMVFGMVVVGGSTRLTRSGLSMTDWKLTGRPLPRNDGEWQIEFSKYKNFPEYKRLNMSMSMEEFKSIYWWEWGHRMWGRAIGVVFVAPLIYFAARRQIPKDMYGRLAVLMGMGGGQGLIGWWMVRSGLEHTHVFGIERSEHDTPRVSPYRLATHLSMAFATYGLLTFTAMDLWRRSSSSSSSSTSSPAALATKELSSSTSVLRSLRHLRGVAALMTGVLSVTVLSGAFVAGNDAGRAYNDWPLMAGQWIPAEIWDSSLGIRNFFENTATVQFDHRVLAMTTVASVGAILMLARQPGVWAILPPEAKAAVLAMAGVTVGQFTLGVTTLVNYVPVHLGVAHQAGALSTWTAAVCLLNMLKHVK